MKDDLNHEAIHHTNWGVVIADRFSGCNIPLTILFGFFAEIRYVLSRIMGQYLWLFF